MDYVITLILAALLGLIPAKLASDKGYSFVLWWFFGFMLFIVAIVAVMFLKDQNVQNPTDELLKYKELLDNGTITQKEFWAKKEQILNQKKYIYSKGPADELTKYKELLDKGVITPGEFEAKKNQILKL